MKWERCQLRQCPICFMIYPSQLEMEMHKLMHNKQGAAAADKSTTQDIDNSSHDVPTGQTGTNDLDDEIPDAQSSAKLDTSENQINDSKDDDANLSVNDGNTSLNSSLNSSQEKDEDSESKTNVDGQMIFTCNVCRTFKGTLDESRWHQSENHPDFPHVCTSIMCLGAYKTPSGLLKHINRRHLATGTK